MVLRHDVSDDDNDDYDDEVLVGASKLSVKKGRVEEELRSSYPPITYLQDIRL